MLKMRQRNLLGLLFGFSLLSLLLPFFTSPASAQGVYEAWVARHNGTGNNNDGASALAVDDNGNVYVTGSSWSDTSLNDYATIKYSSSGDTLWVRRYNGPVNSEDGASALAVDHSGNVYVTGSSWSGWSGASYDYATIKYSPSGDTLWVRRYNGPGNYYTDVTTALAVDGSGNVYVTGNSGVDPNYDYATIKYSPSGDTLWVRRYNGPGNGNDGVSALAIDDSGNVYVTGGSDSDPGSFTYNYVYATIKYSPAGDTLWVRRYDGPGNYDGASALAVDYSGNVYVTGAIWDSGTSYDYATIKYSPAGDTLWVRRYNGPGNYYTDVTTALAVDGSGNVYVTGYSWWYPSGTSEDYATIKYSSAGDTLWVRRYNGPGNNGDWATALAVDDSGNLYVTGRSLGYGTSYDYATIKYSSAGDTLWVRSYNGSANAGDVAYDIAVDNSGNVYVTGGSAGSSTSGDYATIKYSPCGSANPKTGDVNDDGQIFLSDIVRIINYLFKDELLPDPLCRADTNANGIVTFPDIIYLVNFLFKSGPQPQPTGTCCL